MCSKYPGPISLGSVFGISVHVCSVVSEIKVSMNGAQYVTRLESPYSSQDPKKRWSVQLRTCTDTPIALSKPLATCHMGLCSRSKFEHNQFSRSQDIEVGCARAHVHSDIPWAC